MEAGTNLKDYIQFMGDLDLFPAGQLSMGSVVSLGITGTAQYGQTLTADAQVIAGNSLDTSKFTYQWQSAATADGAYANITGATSKTYKAAKADVGKFLKVEVGTTEENVKGTITSNATAAVAKMDVDLSGVTMTAASVKKDATTKTAAATGTYKVMDGTTELDTINVTGTATYTDVASTGAKTGLALSGVDYDNKDYYNATALPTTASGEVVDKSITKIEITGTPTGAKAGTDLDLTGIEIKVTYDSGNPDTLTLAQALAAGYTVTIGGTAVTSATQKIPATRDADGKMSITVSKDGKNEVTVKFNVAKADITGTVTIDNTAPTYGDKLTATVSGLNAGATAKYEWYRGTTKISGATAATYTTVKADVGQQIKVVVSADAVDKTIESAQTTAVAKKTVDLTGTKLTVPDILVGGTKVHANQSYAIPTAKLVTGDAVTMKYTATYTDNTTPNNAAEVTISDVTYTATGFTPTDCYTFTNAPAKTTGKVTDKTLTEVTGITFTGTLTAGEAADLTGMIKVNVKYDNNTTAELTLAEAIAAGIKITIDGVEVTAANMANFTVNKTGSVTVKAEYKTSSKTTTATVGQGALTGKPAITGTAKYGETLTADLTALSDTTGATIKWLVDGTEAATGTTYKVKAADVGKKIKIEVTTTGAAGKVESDETAAVAAIAIDLSDVEIKVPSIKEGATTLTVNGTYEVPTDKGLIDGDAITMNYTATYADSVAAADVAVTLSAITYTGANAKGYAFTDPTTAKGTVRAVGAVSITGDAIYGETLTAEDGGTIATPAYQWYRDGEAIEGATSKTYTIGKDDVGKVVKVIVTGGEEPAEDETAPVAKKVIDISERPVSVPDATQGSSRTVTATGTVPADYLVDPDTVTFTVDATYDSTATIADDVHVTIDPATAEFELADGTDASAYYIFQNMITDATGNVVAGYTPPVTTTVVATGITLDKELLRGHVGDTEKLTATITPSNATSKRVTWKSADESVATVDKDGVVTFVGKGETTITASTSNGKTATARVVVTEPILNVEALDPFMIGYEDHSFRPEDNITRAEAAMMFSRMLTTKMEADKTYDGGFTDVVGDVWYSNAIGFVKGFGIITGDPEGTFRPDDTITRAEFAAMVFRAMDMDISETIEDGTYPDSAEAGWAKDIMLTLAEAGILKGDGGLLAPERSITRAEVATLMVRLLKNQSLAEGASIFPNDVAGSHWAYDSIIKAMNTRVKNLIDGE